MSFTLIEDEFFSSQPYIPTIQENIQNSKKRSCNDDGYNMGSNKKRKLNESLFEFISDVNDDLNDGEITDLKCNDDGHSDEQDKQLSINNIETDTFISNISRHTQDENNKTNDSDNITENKHNINDNSAPEYDENQLFIIGQTYQLNLGKKSKILTLKSLNDNEMVFENDRQKEIKLTRYNGMNANHNHNVHRNDGELTPKTKKQRKRIKGKRRKRRIKAKKRKKKYKKNSPKKVETEEDIDMNVDNDSGSERESERESEDEPPTTLGKQFHKWSKDEEQLMMKLSKTKEYIYHQTTKNGQQIKKIKWKKAWKDNKNNFSQGRTWSSIRNKFMRMKTLKKSEDMQKQVQILKKQQKLQYKMMDDLPLTQPF